MHIISIIFILTLLAIGVYASVISQLPSRHIFAILNENGTCTDGIQKKVPPQILNNNGINGSFQNLISDNRELAEMICQNFLNGNVTNSMSPKILDFPEEWLLIKYTNQ